MNKNNRYRIHWRNRENGRSGVSRRTFAKEDADKLAAEFNREYPKIEHEVKEVSRG